MTHIVRDKLFIGGRWVAATSQHVSPIVNPATEATYAEVAEASIADVEAAIRAARTAFDDGPWPRMKPAERARILSRMADIMRERQRELTDLDILEAGRARMLAESLFVDTPIEHFQDMAERVLPSFSFSEGMHPHVSPHGVGSGVICREPHGVASIITPYNAPFFLAAFKLGPALAAGCTTVLKPSPLTPLSAFVMAEIAEQADLPPGVVNVVTGAPEVGAVLSSHRGVDVVSFTGSDGVGRKVMSQASDTLKKVVLELGGKSANIVCDDADLSKVVADVLMNFTVNAGQGCTMLTRTLVHKSLHDDLIAGLKAAVAHIKVGDPADPTVTMGPLISAAQREKVEQLIRTGVDEGAELVFGGGRPTHLDKGFFIEPTLFAEVDNAMTIAQREFFGPVMVVIPFETEAEAVELANNSDYGLAAGVWSADPTRAFRIAHQLRAGSVLLNGGGGLSPHGPFGGYKQSGLGREWGRWGLDEFLQYKQIVWSMAKG